MRQSTDGTTKILIVVHEFPGSGGARFSKFVRHLPQIGYQPFVLTVRSRTEGANSSDFPGGTKVSRTSCLRKSPFRLFSRLFNSWSLTTYFESLFFVPDLFVTWVPTALLRGLRLIRSEQIPIVITTSPPESTHIIGLLLKRLSGIKWIADFQDLWTTKEIVYHPPTRVHDAVVKRLEKTVYARSDHIIANTTGNRLFYRELFGIPESRITVIPNGYDRSEQHIAGSIQPSGQHAFSIGYMGYFDKPGFPWREFFVAFRSLLGSVDTSEIKLHIAGHMSKEAKRFIEAQGLSAHVVHYGTLPHREAFRLISGCTVLLLLMYETSYSRAIVPHKLYYYLAMGRPIVALAEEDGEVAKIIMKTNIGQTFSAKRVDAAAKMMLDAFHEWKAHGSVPCSPDNEAITAYEYETLTGALARTITAVLKGSEAPRQSELPGATKETSPKTPLLIPPPDRPSRLPSGY